MANMTGEQFFSQCLQSDGAGIPIDWREAASKIYLAAETRMASLENDIERANVREEFLRDLVPTGIDIDVRMDEALQQHELNKLNNPKTEKNS